MTSILDELCGNAEKGLPKRISKRRLADGGGLVITFLEPERDVIIDDATAPELPTAAPEIELQAHVLGETEIPVWCVSPDRVGADHISESAPVGYDVAGHRLGLAELVRDGLDAVTRPTLKRIRAYVLAHAANPTVYSENGIATVYKRELERRRWARQDARAAEKVRGLRSDALKRKSRSIASQATNLHRKGDKRAVVFQRLAGLYAAEEARRVPPDQLTLHEQWAEVGAEYEQAHQALKKRTHPVAKAVIVVDAPVDQGFAERLRQLKAQQRRATLRR